jgi:phytoene synthase
MTADALPLPNAPTVDEAYDFCRAIAHRYGANFSVGFRFLPRVKRRAVYAAYAFCRWADDIADEVEDRHSCLSPVAGSEDRQECLSSTEQLDAWQTELDLCYAGQPSHPITVALADALQHFAIPKTAFSALIDGCRQDVVKHRYETFDELLHYCELVATSISDISLAIFGYRTNAAIAHGRNLATALQLTNVTRDVGDDLARDRIYLPAEELRQFGVREEEIVGKVESDRLRHLIEFQIDRAEGYFRAAEPLLGELSADARFPVILMGGVYATVLARLRHDPLSVLRRRLSLSRMEKTMVVLRRIFRPHFV